jgi:hypothetical protein
MAVPCQVFKESATTEKNKRQPVWHATYNFLICHGTVTTDWYGAIFQSKGEK